jgi:protein TonB
MSGRLSLWLLLSAAVHGGLVAGTLVAVGIVSPPPPLFLNLVDGLLPAESAAVRPSGRPGDTAPAGGRSGDGRDRAALGSGVPAPRAPAAGPTREPASLAARAPQPATPPESVPLRAEPTWTEETLLPAPEVREPEPLPVPPVPLPPPVPVAQGSPEPAPAPLPVLVAEPSASPSPPGVTGLAQTSSAGATAGAASVGSPAPATAGASGAGAGVARPSGAVATGNAPGAGEGPGGTGKPGTSAGGTMAMAVPGGREAAEYDAYLALVRRRIHERLTYPSSARQRGLRGTVEIEVEITASGAIGRVSLAAGSSHRVLDEAALDAARGLRRVPFPPEVRPRPLRVRLPIMFDLR